MTERAILLGVVLVACAAAGVSSGDRAAGDATARLTPVADSYVTAASPGANFGTASSMLVGRRPASVAYLRFRVAVPAAATVSRATLRLFATSETVGRLTVHRVGSSAWAEKTITWANAPVVSARVTASAPVTRGGRYVSVDVTPLVGHGGVVSVAVKGAAAEMLSLRSRESAAGRPLLLVQTSTGGGATTTGPTPGGGTTGVPCGTAAAPRGVDHVIWIWMENKPYDSVIGSPSAPFENQLAAACGLATNYRGVAHPSLPNYIAATSGSAQGIADDDPPSSHPLDVASIFSQVKAAGKAWRAYEESAPGTCPQSPSGSYAVRHDPAAYYTGIRSDCAVWDVPMGSTSGGSFLSDLQSGSLPAFSFVTPDICNDTHDCPVATGDAWLQSWFAKILASPNYTAGNTVVFVVWDEDDLVSGNNVPLLVVSPSTRPGTQSSTAFDHYALLKTTEQLLGLSPFLGHAGDAGTPSMLSAFNLG